LALAPYGPLVLGQARDESPSQVRALENLILSLSEDEVPGRTAGAWSEQRNLFLLPKIILPDHSTNEAPSNKPTI
jgi:hypothetical protein